jgi:hypothetical protein
MLKSYLNSNLKKIAIIFSAQLLQLASVSFCNAQEKEPGFVTCSLYNEDGTVRLGRFTYEDARSALEASIGAHINLTVSKSEAETKKILLNHCMKIAPLNVKPRVEKCRSFPYSSVYLWATWEGGKYKLAKFGTLSYQPAETQVVSEGCNPQYMGGPCSVSSGRRQKISEETCSILKSP